MKKGKKSAESSQIHWLDHEVKKVAIPASAVMAMFLMAQPKDVQAAEIELNQPMEKENETAVEEENSAAVQEVSKDPVIDETTEGSTNTLVQAPAEPKEADPTLRTANTDSTLVVDGDLNNFAAPIPIGEITVDYNKMRDSSVVPEIINDNYSAGTGGSNTYAFYEGALIGQTRTQVSGDLFSYTFKNAATLSDKSTADVVVTFSDMDLYIGGIESKVYHGKLRMTQGAMLPSGAVVSGYSSEAPWAFTFSYKVSITVKGASGTFLLPFQGINMDQYGYNSWKNLEDFWGSEFVRERMEFDPSDIASNVYVSAEHTNHSYLDGQTIKMEGVRGSADQSYVSGAAVGMDAQNNAVRIFAIGAQSPTGTSPATSYIRLGQLVHTIDSSTGSHGNIQTTKGTDSKSANADGSLTDDTVLNPGYYSIPDGKSVTYTMTPDKGYAFRRLTVDGAEVAPVEHTKADGTKYYTYTFDNNAADHTIYVEWQPVYTITYDSHGGTGTMDDQTYVRYDPTMPSRENTFTKDKRTFKGFYAYIFNPETGKETVVTGTAGWPVLFEHAHEMKWILDGYPGGTVMRMEAQWVHTVTYKDPASGQILKGPDEVLNDDPEPAPPADPTRQGYTFGGWDKTEEDNGDIVYNALWTYTVTYIDSWTGRTIQETITLKDTDPEPAPPADPIRSGYTFNGWTRTEDENGNIVYDANWKRVVTYIDSSSGQILQGPDELFNDDPEPNAPADPTREGYTFAGWTRIEDENGNIIYDAIWTLNPVPPKPDPKPKPEPEPVVRPVVHKGVQTDVQTGMSMWGYFLVGTQVVMNSLRKKKK